MTQLGYALSSEEHAPRDLVRYAALAEEAGFAFAGISDHFHPWVDEQGHSPFVWSVLGGIAQATERLWVFTAVTCPMIRMHPGIVAHAAATTACLMPGRFGLGVGTGEALNEHVFGDRWPPYEKRQQMLEEAVEVIRLLWQGGSQNFDGTHYVLEDARIYDVPDPLPEIVVAAGGRKSAELAGRIGDGLVTTHPDQEVVEAFAASGGNGKKMIGQVSCVWHDDEDEARRIAHRIWPTAGVPGQLTQDLPTPRHFEQAAQSVREEDVAERVVCGPDPEKHIEAIQKLTDVGVDHVYVHQIGPDQEGFFRFYEREVLPQFRDNARLSTASGRVTG